MTATYDASAIQVLEGLSAVRKRPGMYIGSTGERGLHHMVYEVVDNSVDEAMAGHATTVDVTLLADGGVRVRDDGRGIPVDIHPVEKKPAVEVVMTILHAGGKFGGGGYLVSGGLHGVGISVVNALSHRVDVAIRRAGALHTMSFADGGIPQGPLVSVPLASTTREDGVTLDTGTQVTFYADPTIFETTTYSFETLARRFQEMAFLNRGLRINFTDERLTDQPAQSGEQADSEHHGAPAAVQPKSVTFHYEGGIADFVRHLNATRAPVHASVIEISGEQEGLSVEIAAQWSDAYSTSVYSFANTINTHEGGTHEEGFRAALTGLVNRYAREKGLLKDKDENLSGEDVREGLTAIISVKIAEPQFEGQTKTKLGNSEAKSFVQRITNEALADWLDTHPTEAKDIVSKAQLAARARAAARRSRDLVRRKTVLSATSMPGKLKDCISNDPAECEVYIVEGDSAGGSAATGRDPHTQAILPIRGKILNVEKATLDKALGNAEVEALITAFGCGFQEEFDLTKLRYGKIVLMADADVDGQHISTLLLTLLFRYMRPLIEHGHVYLAQPPLYKVKWDRKGEQVTYVYSDAERDAVITDAIAAGKRDPRTYEGVQRYKGLGEMDAAELWETTMNPDNRVLLRITLDDAILADALFSTLMGEDVDPRREYITRNAADVRFLDI